MCFNEILSDYNKFRQKLVSRVKEDRVLSENNIIQDVFIFIFKKNSLIKEKMNIMKLLKNWNMKINKLKKIMMLCI